MPLPTLDRTFGLVAAITALVACGGTVNANGNTGGNSGSLSATGGGSFGVSGTIGTGGAVGAGGAVGTGGAIGTGGVCCNSRAHCSDGDTELGGGSSCPAGATCYVQPAVCCSPAVLCAHYEMTPGGASNGGASNGGASTGGASTGGVSNVAGNAGLGGWAWGTPSASVGGACSAPSCAAGYALANSDCTITSPNPCYSLDDCGGGFTCAKLSATCNRAAEYNRKYVSGDTTTCQVTFIECVANTTSFKDACGCGCEQPSSCPQWVDCMPSADPAATYSSLCRSSLCPYTLRAP